MSFVFLILRSDHLRAENVNRIRQIDYICSEKKNETQSCHSASVSNRFLQALIKNNKNSLVQGDEKKGKQSDKTREEPMAMAGSKST